MKYSIIISTLLLSIVLFACTDDKQSVEDKSVLDNPTNQELPSGTQIEHELLFNLNFIPHEVGTSLSLIQDPQLYETWADIFQFPSVPEVDFKTEEVLFVTTYADSCDRIFEEVTKEGDTLLVKINYPKALQQIAQIACNELAVPKTFVVKMKKTGLTYGTLIEVNRVLLEKQSILYEVKQ
ncbi:dehydrogenase [Solibacillus sp. FSL R7-0682]|uniref:dehydrogenase n=1 Tax=Solibacillus sp. FSL R7-0682 TaxID=2921690 RepID=UPI0030F5C321